MSKSKSGFTERDLLNDVELPDDEQPAPKLDLAVQFLRETLKDGPVPTADLAEQAKTAGLSWATIRRAADRLGVTTEKAGFQGPWAWRLPEDGILWTETPSKPAENLASAEVAHLSNYEKGEDLCGTQGGQAPKTLTPIFVVGETPRKEPGKPAAPEPYETKSSATVDYRLRSRLRASEDKEATEPLPYEVLGVPVTGERCTLCGGGRDVERIRYCGQLRLWHRACADRYVAAMAGPPAPDATAENDGGGSDAAPHPTDPAVLDARAAELLAEAERNPVIRIKDRAAAALYFRGRAARELTPERLDPTIHRMRPPDWSDARDEPQAGDRCSTCRGSQWWTEGGLTKLGWRCCRCRPPHTAIGVHRVQT